MLIGIIKERKNPPDKRVPFSPEVCKKIQEKYPVIFKVESSDIRCFSDDDYRKAGIEVVNDVSNCDILMGVKEVPLDFIVPNKPYLFFSHTIKKQAYNQKLLKKLVENGNQMIDYECLVNEKGERILGFGKHAGIVGAYNALLTYGLKNNLFVLKPAHLCANYADLIANIKELVLPPLKIVVTGKGRVGKGVWMLLNDAGLVEVKSDQFIQSDMNNPHFTILEISDYYQKNNSFDLHDFYSNSASYSSTLHPYLTQADIYISAHFWDGKAPELFNQKTIGDKLQVIADITCDIKGSIPTTLRASSITNPIYGVDKKTFLESDFKKENALAVMAVDNLPCELPADASHDFGLALMEFVVPELLKLNESDLINRASICKNGALTPKFMYLSDYLKS
jgi:saccharopine dehydrogenase (NAD+, L-lysine-forming)